MSWRPVVLLFAGQLCLACSGGAPFSPEPYLNDLDQLEAFTATAYANFEWAGIAADLAVERVRGETGKQRGARFRTRLEEWVGGLEG